MKSILIRLYAKTPLVNGDKEWSPQTDSHVEFLARQAMDRTQLDYDIIKIED